jgi:hypothetical protein
MITTLNDKGWISVEVPMHTNKVDAVPGAIQTYNGFGAVTVIAIPKSYTFCFLYPEGVTEEWAREIVERWDSGKYTDYTRHLARVDTAIESLRTLMQSLNIHDKTIAVCQRKY